MSDIYKTSSTSPNSADVEELILSTTQTTRVVLRATIVKNEENPSATVNTTIVHQRQKPSEQWEDLKSKPLNMLKAGEVARFNLDSASTLKLYDELKRLYSIANEKGVPQGTSKLIVGYEGEVIRVPRKKGKLILQLLDQNHSNELLLDIVSSAPELVSKMSLIQLNKERSIALEVFETNLRQNQDESFWQAFFETNNWILGYGLNYKFLNNIQSQPYYGGSTVTGSGAQRGDILTASDANVRYTTLVEIKKPSTDLLSSKEYRNATFQPSKELSGGIAQLQVNCRTWESEGSKSDSARETLGSAGIYTVQPKGILIIGNTNQLITHAQRVSFEVLRRNITNPEVMTFDELLARARFIVEHTKDFKR